MCTSVLIQDESRLDCFFLFDVSYQRFLTLSFLQEKGTKVRGPSWLSDVTSPDAQWITSAFLLFSAEIPLEDDYPTH
jgi:hypothetical protein